MLVATSACGPSLPPAGSGDAVDQRPPLVLVELVPAQASVVVEASPTAIAASPSLLAIAHAFAPDERLDAFSARHGVDPRTLDELVWADTEDGWLLLVRGPFMSRSVVGEVGARMAPVESSADAPWMRRAGVYRGSRLELVALEEHTLLLVAGAPSLTAAVLARAAGDDREPGALGGAEVAALRAEHLGRPLLVHAPQPLGLPLDSGVGLLLARETALLASLHATEDGHVALAVDLRGEFPPGADENFRALVGSLADSDLGRAVGMEDAASSLRAQADERQVLLQTSVPAAVVASGLRVLFDAEIRELLARASSGRAASSPLVAELRQVR